MEYLQLFKKLQQGNIRYLVCGGLAVNIYGIPRMTADVDLLLDFTEENINSFDDLVKILSYQSVIPISIRTYINKEDRQKAISEKNLIAYSYFNTQSSQMNLDVLMDVPILFEELWDRKEIRKVGDVEVNIVSVEHLIDLKKYANRKQDIDDIILLSKFL